MWQRRCDWDLHTRAEVWKPPYDFIIGSETVCDRCVPSELYCALESTYFLVQCECQRPHDRRRYWKHSILGIFYFPQFFFFQFSKCWDCGGCCCCKIKSNGISMHCALDLCVWVWARSSTVAQRVIHHKYVNVAEWQRARAWTHTLTRRTNSLEKKIRKTEKS